MYYHMVTETYKQEKRKKMIDLRVKLGNLSQEQRQQIASTYRVINVDGRVLSLNNTVLLHLQSNGIQPTVVAGFKQWKSAGKCVRKGEHGFMIWFPVGNKNDDTGDIDDPTYFYTTYVFDISQVDDIGNNNESKPNNNERITPIVEKPNNTQYEQPRSDNNDIMKGWNIV